MTEEQPRPSGQTAASSADRAWLDAELCAIRARLGAPPPWFRPDLPEAEETTAAAAEGGHAGLALSGGGIRSAALCLGLLQALHRQGLLAAFGWLSTVSGGGYTGTGWLAHALQAKDFPFGGPEGRGSPMRRLRDHASYLMAPGLWPLARAGGMLLRKLLANLALLAPLVLLLAGLLPLLDAGWQALGLTLAWGWVAAGVSLLALAAAIGLHLEGGAGDGAAGWRWRLDGLAAAVLLLVLAATGLLVLATAAGWMPRVGDWLQWLLGKAGAALPSSLPGLVGSLAGLMGAGTLASRLKGRYATLVLALLGLLFLVALIAVALALPPQLQGIWPFDTGRGAVFQAGQMLVAGLLALQLMAWIVDANALSMHGYYRDRLADAFFPAGPAPKLAALLPEATGGPLPIINATVAGAPGPDMRRRGRPAGPFSLTPLQCGSAAQGYADTGLLQQRAPEFDAAGAMALSAAAVSPLAGRVTGGRVAVFFKSLFNARTGRWLPNPAILSAIAAPPRAHGWLALREMLGRPPRGRKATMLLVSDGGHWENLGILSLVHRHCPLILAVDAEADPDWKFNGLGIATLLSRLDAGTEIAVATDALLPQAGRSARHVQEGSITYPGGATGLLIYAKSTLTGDEPPDVRAYAAANPAFPHETTADQFFSEQQFEAYRRLGEHIGEQEVAPLLRQVLQHSVPLPPLHCPPKA